MVCWLTRLLIVFSRRKSSKRLAERDNYALYKGKSDRGSGCIQERPGTHMLG